MKKEDFFWLTDQGFPITLMKILDRDRLLALEFF